MLSPGIATIDPAMVVTTVGKGIVGGFADGTFINVEYTADFFSKVTGSDGLTTRIKQNDFSGTITLTLKQSSLSNDFLMSLVILDRQANAGIVPVSIKDLLGTTKMVTGFAWVRKPPASVYSKNVENREWILDCATLRMYVGGNVQIPVV